MIIQTMINLFKKSESNKVAVAESDADLTGKSVNDIIEEIHETFYTEVDRLLADVKVLRSLDTDKQDLLDKCQRLKSLGFKNTKEVKEAEDEIKRLDKLKRENENNEKLANAIEYFSFKYPNYKFITEDSVKKICAKYNLVYGSVEHYIGTVPDKNLKHIEEFKIDENDECHWHREWYQDAFFGKFGEKQHYQTVKESIKSQESITPEGIYLRIGDGKVVIDSSCPLEIAAPAKDFNMESMEVKNYQISKIEIPDPVVLKPVIYEGVKHYLIVTAWGIEASDELVVNQKMN